MRVFLYLFLCRIPERNQSNLLGGGFKFTAQMYILIISFSDVDFESVNVILK